LTGRIGDGECQDWTARSLKLKRSAGCCDVLDTSSDGAVSARERLKIEIGIAGG
jgi:hypothetical protein